MLSVLGGSVRGSRNPTAGACGIACENLQSNSWPKTKVTRD